MNTYELRSLSFFQRELDEVCGRFPKSAVSIRTLINALPDNPEAGDAYPKLKIIIPVRKLRIALKAYSISKRDGLRLIFAVHEEKRRILPLYLYKKGGHGGEQEVRAQIKRRLKLALAELETQMDDPPEE